MNKENMHKAIVSIFIFLVGLGNTQTSAASPERLRGTAAFPNLQLPDFIEGKEGANEEDAVVYCPPVGSTPKNPYVELVDLSPEPSRDELHVRLQSISKTSQQLILGQSEGLEETVILYGIKRGKIRTVQAIVDSLPAKIIHALVFLEAIDSNEKACSLIISYLTQAIANFPATGDERLTELESLKESLIQKAFADETRTTRVARQNKFNFAQTSPPTTA
jgi:hypothetical protein